MALTNADIASSTADSLCDVADFKLYIENNRPDKASLLLLSDDVLSAYLRQVSAVFNTFLWRGEVIPHSILFNATTVTIASNVITFDDIPSFTAAGMYPSDIAGDSFFTYRNTDTTYNSSVYGVKPYWLKLVGCANPENDGFIYPYSIDDSTITNDIRYKRLTDEASTANVQVWLEAYILGAYQGFDQSQSWPRRKVFINNTEHHVIPSTIMTAIYETAVFQSVSNIVSNSTGITTEDLSSLDLGGDLVVEFDRSEISKTPKQSALSIPIPDHVLAMIQPYLYRLPGMEGIGGGSKAIRV
jgi:alpha-mannosidase